jgi:aldose 1-epimerase
MSLHHLSFGVLPDGSPVDLFVLANSAGLEASIMTYGGTLIALKVPDREGHSADVVLGFDSLEPYLGAQPYLGALIGRYGNRIARASFTLEGVTHALTANEKANLLHGGAVGFDRKIWAAAVEERGDEPRLVLSCRSADGDQGFPGNLQATVTYTLQGRELRIDYAASTDRATVVNLTHHAYFNLHGGGDILDHVLQIHASHFLPVSDGLIPTGELRPVRGTPMDFTQPAPIGSRIGQADEQLAVADGYDHNWVLDRRGPGCQAAAEVFEPASGRRMKVLTTQPGLQFYSGNVFDGTLRGKAGVAYHKHAGFCLETQHFPDSPNQPSFPSTLLQPGQVYVETTVFGFSW